MGFYTNNVKRLARGEEPLTFDQYAEEDRAKRRGWQKRSKGLLAKSKSIAERKLRSSMLRAQAIGCAFDLDAAWIAERLLAGKCEVTGIEFISGTLRDPWHPTIDRKDPVLGYTKDNCQMVVWLYNRAKGAGNADDVLKMAKALAKTS